MSEPTKVERIKVIKDFLDNIEVNTRWQIKHCERINAYVLQTWLERHLKGIQELQGYAATEIEKALNEPPTP